MNNTLKVNKTSSKRLVLVILFNVITIAIFAFFLFAQIFPFLLKITESLQPRTFVGDPGKIYLFPQSFNFANYKDAWLLAKVWEGFFNSIVNAAVFLSISTIIVLVMAYVFAKRQFKGKNIIFYALLSTLMVPGEVLMISNYMLIASLGLVDTRFAVIFPGIVNIFGMFMTRQFMLSIPDSLLESARLEGASELRIIFTIVAPIAMPVLSSYIILTFIANWNEYLWPNLILSSSELFTIQLKLMYFSSATADKTFDILKSAGLMIAALPVVIVYLVFQSKFIEGVSATGLK